MKKSIAKKYVSDAQRKAVHASKADGGKGSPNKMSEKGVTKDKLKTSKENRQQKGLTTSELKLRNEKELKSSLELPIPNFDEQKQKISPALSKLSASCKAAAKRKFKVYPSAYANMWASKTQKAGKC